MLWTPFKLFRFLLEASSLPIRSKDEVQRWLVLPMSRHNGLLTVREGMWLAGEGKRLEYAEDIYSIKASDDSKKLSLLCPTAQIRSRGDTLNRPTVTLVCKYPVVDKVA